jgi:PAS domain-containing protein
MATHPVEVILMRELASHLATPIFLCDPNGDLLFYNEPAEQLLCSRFDETGPMPYEQWATMFKPADEDGAPIPPEDLPLAIAVQRERPALGTMWVRSLDGGRHHLEVAAIPLRGQWGEHLGAAAVFWETQ